MLIPQKNRCPSPHPAEVLFSRSRPALLISTNFFPCIGFPGIRTDPAYGSGPEKKGHPPNPIGYHHLSHEISFSGVYQVYHYTVKLYHIPSSETPNYHWRWVKRSINAHGLVVHDTLTANLIQRIHHVQHLIVLPCGDDMPWKKLTPSRWHLGMEPLEDLKLRLHRQCQERGFNYTRKEIWKIIQA